MSTTTHVTGIASDGKRTRQYTIMIEDDGTFSMETPSRKRAAGRPHDYRWLSVTGNRGLLATPLRPGSKHHDGRQTEGAVGMFVNNLSRYPVNAKGAIMGAWTDFATFAEKTLGYSSKTSYNTTPEQRAERVVAMVAQEVWPQEA